MAIGGAAGERVPAPIDRELDGRGAEKPFLCRAGKDEGHPPEVREELLQEREAFVAAPLATGTEPIRNDADRAAGDARGVVGPLELRVEAVDRAGLPDVERRAGRGSGCRIDEQHAPDAIGGGEGARGGAADLARAGDRNGRHE